MHKKGMEVDAEKDFVSPPNGGEIRALTIQNRQTSDRRDCVIQFSKLCHRYTPWSKNYNFPTHTHTQKYVDVLSSSIKCISIHTENQANF